MSKLINQSPNIPASAKVIYAPYTSDDKVVVSSEGLTDCPPGAIDGACSGPVQKQLSFTRTLNGESACFTFYLNVGFVSPSMINDFVNKMLLVTEKDSVFIHCPSELYLDDAEFLASSIELCKSKNIIMSAPYILNSGAAYLLTKATKIVTSKCAVMHIGLPTITAFGKVVDADNAVACNKYRILHVLKALQHCGFIASDEEFLHIVKKQGSIMLCGKKLQNVIDNLNNPQTE